MNLASFLVRAEPRWGIVTATGLIDASLHLGERHATLASALTPEGLAALRRLDGLTPDHPLDAVRWLPPVVGETRVFCVLLNYESSRLAQGRPKLQYPHLVTRLADTHVGSGSPLVKPLASGEFDFEGEIAVVIGQGGRRIDPADAWSHVAGLAPYNDATPRDWMRHSRQFTQAKSFPGTGGFGPWITTLDAIPDTAAVTLETRLNGETMQTGHLGDLTYPVPELIGYISTFTTLRPGDVIATGTPSGSGYKRMPPRFLKAGDVVEVTVSGVGTLENPVIDET